MAPSESFDVAKKNTSENATPAAPKRAATRRTTTKPTEPDTAPDMSTTSAGDAGNGAAGARYQPSADEIAQAAYMRYLSRGGADGRDFDDWIEAERELANRNIGR